MDNNLQNSLALSQKEQGKRQRGNKRVIKESTIPTVKSRDPRTSRTLSERKRK